MVSSRGGRGQYRQDGQGRRVSRAGRLHADETDDQGDRRQGASTTLLNGLTHRQLTYCYRSQNIAVTQMWDEQGTPKVSRAEDLPEDLQASLMWTAMGADTKDMSL